ESGNLDGDNLVIRAFFEVTSAFGTVGLTTGVTPHLSIAGKILIIITMFAGRIGPLTLALAVALKEEKVVYTYPEEKVMVG
ncbi:MAG: potassium transporter TrkG, partial [Candidatus Omnitrophota bacterium]|nr:potassium transporter TrkG [Candidatus Omnitrophota bacterium]